jgi:hypothetical protein
MPLKLTPADLLIIKSALKQFQSTLSEKSIAAIEEYDDILLDALFEVKVRVKALQDKLEE